MADTTETATETATETGTTTNTAANAPAGWDGPVDQQLEAQVRALLDQAGENKLIPIVQAGEPVLRQQARRYEGQLEAGTLRRLVEAMRVTMLAAPGVGLAAPQIGLPLTMAVVEDHVRKNRGKEPAAAGASAPGYVDPREIVEFPFHAIINPVYEPVPEAGQASFYEGCLSMDGYQAVRRRWLDVIARWQDEDGISHEERLHGWPARIFQHETDHLHGELYIDQAQLRSLTNYANLRTLWSADVRPTAAAEALGFEL